MTSPVVLKEAVELQTPVLLFECRLSDGTLEYWSTHRLSFEGVAYEPRIIAQHLFEMRAAVDGADSRGTVSVSLDNIDGYFSQLDRAIGIKGAKLTIRFMFFDVATLTPVSEPLVVYLGTADPPSEFGETTVKVTFRSRLEFSRMLLPQIRIQSRCPWMFPRSEQERLEAVSGGESGAHSMFYRCGYSAGQESGRGNLNGGQPYTSCDFSVDACRARGMFDRDDTGLVTRRFGGIQYLPVSSLVRTFGDKSIHFAEIQENAAKYNDFVPLVYGRALYQPPIVFTRNDGNLTHLEVLLGVGEMAGVQRVVVNDIEVPRGVHGQNMTATGWFNICSLGARTGDFNQDFRDNSGTPIGDPYGSMAYLSVVVPNQVSDGKAIPKVQVIAEGVMLPSYGEDGSYLGQAFTQNPSWIVLDILRRLGWTLAELDLASFARAAAFCDEPIPARDLNGLTIQVPRFQVNLVLRKRRSAADILRGIRFASGLILRFGVDGRLQLISEATMARQQPTKPFGTNSNAALAGGWPAYEFCDGTMGFGGILRTGTGQPSLRLWSRSTAETPNRFSVEFQDEFNGYQQDSVSEVDLDDVLQVGQEISASLPALGLPHFDQALRVLRSQLLKATKGNLFAEFETTVKGLGLRPGDLITLTYAHEGLERQPFRIQAIAPTANFHKVKIVAQLHGDDWYHILDGGIDQASGASLSSMGSVSAPRPIWGTSTDEEGYPVFGCVESVVALSDGNAETRLGLRFSRPPELSAASHLRPMVGLNPVIEPGATGLEPDTDYYYAVSAVTEAGEESGLSFLVRASLPPSETPFVVELRALKPPTGCTAFRIYRSTSPQSLRQIAEVPSSETSFRDEGLPETVSLPPDRQYHHANFYSRLELSPPFPADLRGETMVGHEALSMIPDEYKGRVVRIVRGRGAGQEAVVVENTEKTLLVDSPWQPALDGTSLFVVCERNWEWQGSTEGNQIEVILPNRFGMMLQIQGRSASLADLECGPRISPVFRWSIGSGSGNLQDQEPPPAPNFSLMPQRGAVEIHGIGFPTLDNTRSITAGTLTLYYWPEFNGLPVHSVAEDFSDEQTSMVGTSDAAAIGDFVQINQEIVRIVSIEGPNRDVYTITRGHFGTFPQPHSRGAVLWALKQRIATFSFPKEFFGSLASGSFSGVVPLPAVRIATAEFYVTNVQGNSPVGVADFTNLEDDGLRILPGGQYVIQVEGHAAVASNGAPPLVVDTLRIVRDIFATVSASPTHQPLELRVTADGQPYCNLVIPPLSVQSQVVSGVTLPPLQEGTILGLDIVSVGTGDGVEPGRDLTVTIRL